MRKVPNDAVCTEPRRAARDAVGTTALPDARRCRSGLAGPARCASLAAQAVGKNVLGPSTSGDCRTGNEPEKTSTMPN